MIGTLEWFQINSKRKCCNAVLPAEKVELYQNALKRAGLRLTDQRQWICAYLAETERHPTPYEVCDDLAQNHPEISRATVYNTLNTLQQLGVIVELSFGADHTHYDTDPTPHANLICLRCHRIVDYHGDLPLDAMRTQIVADTGFEARSARADLLGLCAACQRGAESTMLGAAQSALTPKAASVAPATLSTKLSATLSATQPTNPSATPSASK